MKANSGPSNAGRLNCVAALIIVFHEMHVTAAQYGSSRETRADADHGAKLHS